MNKYFAELIGTFSGSDHWVFGHRPRCRPACPSSNRLRAHGDDFCRRAYFGSALQSGRYAGHLAARKVRGKRAPYMMFQIIGAVLAAFAVKFLKAGTPLGRSIWQLYPHF
jgi:hypothetical protein